MLAARLIVGGGVWWVEKGLVAVEMDGSGLMDEWIDGWMSGKQMLGRPGDLYMH
jgi:hypothetical protein